ALAIGTGYRVNEGFSARAGFALSGGDVSGGAGINYEW
ncbi:YadA-like protein, partial [Nicoletella semolina]